MGEQTRKKERGWFFRATVAVIGFVGVGGLIALANFYIDLQERDRRNYAQKIDQYNKEVKEWEEWTPRVKSEGTLTIDSHYGIDLDTGMVNSLWNTPNMDIFYAGYGSWNPAKKNSGHFAEYLRALNGVRWHDGGRINDKDIQYRGVRNAKFQTKKDSQTGYPDLFYGHPSNSPTNNVYFIKTTSGNVAVFRIIDYETENNQNNYSRKVRVNYKTYPVNVDDKPRPVRPRR